MSAEWNISRISLRAKKTPFPGSVCGRVGRSGDAAMFIAEGHFLLSAPFHIPTLLRRR